MDAYENAKIVTVCLQIGNSDNKLSQQEWANYVFQTDEQVTRFARERHFFGGAETWARWQNVCWIFVMEEQRIESFSRGLTIIRQNFSQESMAILVGETKFI